MDFYQTTPRNVEYILLAEFDITAGSTVKHQFPYPIGVDQQSAHPPSLFFSPASFQIHPAPLHVPQNACRVYASGWDAQPPARLDSVLPEPSRPGGRPRGLDAQAAAAKHRPPGRSPVCPPHTPLCQLPLLLPVFHLFTCPPPTARRCPHGSSASTRRRPSGSRWAPRCSACASRTPSASSTAPPRSTACLSFSHPPSLLCDLTAFTLTSNLVLGGTDSGQSTWATR